MKSHIGCFLMIIKIIDFQIENRGCLMSQYPIDLTTCHKTAQVKIG